MDIINLSKSYKSDILVNINLSLKKNNIYALLGRNGAGKTTFLKIIAGLIDYDSGIIKNNNKKILMLPERSYFLDFLSGYDNLLLIGSIYKIERSEIDKLIYQYSLSSFINELVINYSQGMRHQLSLITAFLINPDILLLDEPLTSLDPLNIEYFKEKLIEFAKKDKIVILSTHIIPIAQQLANEIIVLNNQNISVYKHDNFDFVSLNDLFNVMEDKK